MTENTKLQDLLRKIRALRAKAESTNSEAEAAAFAAKAAELMAQYGLEESQLKVEEQSEITHEDAGTDTKLWEQNPARRLLVRTLAKLYMCEIVTFKDGRMVVLGRKHNIAMVREMSEYLIKTTLRLAREWRKRTVASFNDATDFRRGCLVRLTERVREMLHAQRHSSAATYTATGNPGNLPALYGREINLIKAYGSKHFNLRWVASNTKIKMGAAAAEGRRAADTVSFNKQVGAASRSSYMIGSK